MLPGVADILAEKELAILWAQEVEAANLSFKVTVDGLEADVRHLEGEKAALQQYVQSLKLTSAPCECCAESSNDDSLVRSAASQQTVDSSTGQVQKPLTFMERLLATSSAHTRPAACLAAAPSVIAPEELKSAQPQKANSHDGWQIKAGRGSRAGRPHLQTPPADPEKAYLTEQVQVLTSGKQALTQQVQVLTSRQQALTQQVQVLSSGKQELTQQVQVLTSGKQQAEQRAEQCQGIIEQMSLEKRKAALEAQQAPELRARMAELTQHAEQLSAEKADLTQQNWTLAHATSELTARHEQLSSEKAELAELVKTMSVQARQAQAELEGVQAEFQWEAEQQSDRLATLNKVSRLSCPLKTVQKQVCMLPAWTGHTFCLSAAVWYTAFG